MPAKARTVLVVDDSASALEFAAMALEDEGYEVDTAINVAEMVACVQRRKPDLVLVDVNMPELQGHDLVPFLRDVYGIKSPVMLFSDTEEPKLAELAQKAGADGFVRKDPDPTKLVSRVSALIDGKR